MIGIRLDFSHIVVYRHIVHGKFDTDRFAFVRFQRTGFLKTAQLARGRAEKDVFLSDLYGFRRLIIELYDLSALYTADVRYFHVRRHFVSLNGDRLLA